MRMRMFGITVTLAVLSAAGAMGQVDAISFNLAKSSKYWMDPSDVAGFVPVGYWIDNTKTNETQPNFSNVTNSLGEATACDLDLRSALNYGYYNNTVTNDSATPDQIMMKSGMGTSKSGYTMSILVTDVPYAYYDVYLYFGGAGKDAYVPYKFSAYYLAPDGGGGWTTATSTNWILDTDRKWSGTYVQATATSTNGLVDGGENYILFEEMTNTSFQIRTGGLGRRAGPSGFQIVNAPPEPEGTLITIR